MNKFSIKQIPPEMPVNERILKLSERAAFLGEELRRRIFRHKQ